MCFKELFMYAEYNKSMRAFCIMLALLVPSLVSAFMTDEQIALHQADTSAWSVGERIAFWAGQFIGTPYDTDPLGEYVRKKVLVADERVDCMYLTFRAVELSVAKDPQEALLIALDKRFRSRGLLNAGLVRNYEERFEYGEDMLDSGKWGREITGELGRTRDIPGSRGRETVQMLTAENAAGSSALLHSGDIIYFVRQPSRRVSDEIVGHIGIIKKEAGKTYLIHASGLKNRGGRVKKTLLADYLRTMPFAGIRVSRFAP